MTALKQPAQRQDNPASIVVQKPQCSGASWGAPAWASNRKIATVKMARADEKMTMRLRMVMRLADIMVELRRVGCL
ncbi:hypothetical protein AOQ71_03575 [Bradyrhizobium manausense]|uniref:Uncharacterized protein n=1 Tax=Bradyrhizobium manausense TaxID=989370 RepID=A0A0R3E524_9BRAD|nr:hypothetical protein AOQ71_03575 [Bradyrhizobium manausense]